MIKYFDGTVFNTDAKAIVNTVNTVGVMGAGVALEFGLRYPEMLDEYQKKCFNKQLVVGKVDYYKDDQYTIINFPTKWHFKYPSKLEWIEKGLQHFAETYKENNISSVAFPRLGCANGGLSWEKVQPIMEKYLSSLDIDVYICLDKIPSAQGKEKLMVDLYNKCDIDALSKKIRLTKSQKTLLSENKPISRFWHIGKIDGIGMKTYSNIFNYFYVLEENEKCYEQISFF